MVLSPEERRKINPGLSAVLSFVFSGLGQVYNGQILKGLFIMSLSTIGVVLVIIGFIQIVLYILSTSLGKGEILLGGIAFVTGFLMIAVAGVYNIYDAYNTAKKRLEE